MDYISKLPKMKTSELKLILFYYTGKKYKDLKKKELLERIREKTVDLDYINQMNKYFKSLNEKEIEAIKSYQQIGYRLINSFLRDKIIVDRNLYSPHDGLLYASLQIFKDIIDINVYNFIENEDEIRKKLTKKVTDKIDEQVAKFLVLYRKKIKQAYELSKTIKKCINRGPKLTKDIIVFRGVYGNIQYLKSKNQMIKNIKNKSIMSSLKAYGTNKSNIIAILNYFQKYNDIFMLKLMYSNKNDYITDKGFTSTSLNPQIGFNFSGDKCCFFRIKIPKGSSCFIYPVGFNEGWFDRESELLLPPSKFKITKIYRWNYVDPKSIFGKVTYNFDLVKNIKFNKIKKLEISVKDVEIVPLKSKKNKKITKKKVANNNTNNTNTNNTNVNKTKKKTAKKKTAKTKEKSKP